MKTTTNLLRTNLLIVFVLICICSQSQTTAVYDITFTSVWNATDHGTLPGNAHWSKLVGANHNNNVVFLEMGQNASPGIENVAELGDNVVFSNEVNAAVTATDAEQYIDGNDLGTATGNITIIGLQISEDFPLLTLVSMIAPSPDWMIAVNSIDLRENNNWKNSISIDLFPYDAGTDNGVNYTSADDDNDPQDPISSLQGVSPFNTEKIGSLTITLDQVLGIDDNAFDSGIKIFPNPTSEKINISNQTNQDLNSVIIYNVLGKIVEKLDPIGINQTLILQLHNLNSGIYFIKMASIDGQSVTKKIILR